MITPPCPECSSTAVKMRASRICPNGSRRRRCTCRDCNHKWTEYDGPAPLRNRPRKGTEPCTVCGSLYARIIDAERCSNQSIRRRRECISCGYRWTTHEGPPPLIGSVRIYQPLSQPCDCGDQHVHLMASRVLTGGIPYRRWECRACGIRWSEHEEQRAAPTDGITCMQCLQWLPAAGCGLGIPEATIEGPAFAAECPALIHSTPQSLSHE